MRSSLLSRTSFLALAAVSAFSQILSAQTLTIVSGDNQTIPRQGSSVPGGIAEFAALSVSLKDATGKAITNAGVTFHCNPPASGNMRCQLTPSGSDNGTLTVNTDGNGVATLNQMLGKSADVYYADGSVPMSATYGGASVTFHLSVNPNAGPAYLYTSKIVSGDKQTAVRTGTNPYGGTATFGALTIQVLDASGKPASGLRVSYGCTQSGNMACNFGNASINTDGNGMFTVASVSAYYGTGTLTVQFVGDTLQETDFHLTVTDPPAQQVTWVQGAKLTAVGGDYQVHPRQGSEVQGGIATFSPMSVKLTDPSGAPIANAPITFACQKPPYPQQVNNYWACQLTPSGAENGTMSLNTDANGVATLNQMGGNALQFYYDDGTFTMTTSYGSIASYTMHFIVGAPPASMTATAGNTQTAALAPGAVFSPLQVTLLDANKKGVSGLPVTWTCVPTGAMKCQVDPSGAATVTTFTNSSGVAALGGLAGGKSVSVTGGYGSLGVTAVYGGLNAAFQMTVLPQATMAINSGNNQTAIIPANAGVSVMLGLGPLSVKLTDASGKPVSGVPVTFSCLGCGFAGTFTSDANGNATAPYTSTITRLGLDGAMSVVASSPLASPSQVTFTLTIKQAPPTPTLTIVSGNNQTLARTASSSGVPMANFAPLQVRVTTAGAPQANVTVVWTCSHPAAMVCQMDPNSAATTVTTTTDATGLTTLNKVAGNSVSAYYSDGPISVSASYGGVTTNFTLTIPGTPVSTIPQLTILAGNNQSVPRSGTQVAGGVANFAVLSVILTDYKGQPIPDVQVTFSCGPGVASGMACQLSPTGPAAVTATTNARGMAILNLLGGNSARGYYAAGKMPVTASYGGAAVTFNLTVSQ